MINLSQPISLSNQPKHEFVFMQSHKLLWEVGKQPAHRNGLWRQGQEML